MHRINSNQPSFLFRVKGKTTPGPVFRMSHQLSLYGIHVHVLKFLDELGLAPDIEIVKAGLPELGQRVVRLGKRKRELMGGWFSARLASEPPRNALFQDWHGGGRISFGRFADEQMNVIGHDDVTGQRETVAVAHVTENLDEQVFGAFVRKQGQASVATASNEMQMAQSIAAV